MTGIDKARETANKLKKETKVQEEEVKEEVEKGLSLLRHDPILTKLYQDNSTVGADNLAGVSPLLKVHKTGKSSTNELAEGGEPNDGWFFYSPTGQQFKEVECHILTISRGFRANGINKANVFNQIMAGLIIDGKELKPFIMYLTGTKLKKMWEFGKEASKYTRARPVPIPLFALKVKLTTEQIKTDYGKSWIINFDIIKNSEGFPVVILDVGLFNYLKDMVAELKEMINSRITVKSTEEQEEIVRKEDVKEETVIPLEDEPPADRPF